MAMGTDTGGSIRIPASFCGVVGLKPTYGRVSCYGCLPLGHSLDTMGPLAAGVRDAAITLQAIAGYDARDAATSRRAVDNYLPPEGCTIRGLRVGVPRRYYFENLEDGVRAAVERALALAESLGAALVEVETPDIAALNAVARVLLMAEASAMMEPHMAHRELIGADVLALLDQGRFLAATDYIHAQRLRRLMQREFAALFERVDCLFTPATAVAAPEIGQATILVGGAPEDTRLASTRFARGINVLGLPALSMPCGRDARGLPAGLQIVGRAFEEALILRAAAALEDADLGCGAPREIV